MPAVAHNNIGGVAAIEVSIPQLEFLLGARIIGKCITTVYESFPISPENPQLMPSACVRAGGHTKTTIVSQALEIGCLVALTNNPEELNILASTRSNRAISVEPI